MRIFKIVLGAFCCCLSLMPNAGVVQEFKMDLSIFIALMSLGIWLIIEGVINKKT